MAYERYLWDLGEDRSIKVHLCLFGLFKVRVKDRDSERLRLGVLFASLS